MMRRGVRAALTLALLAAASQLGAQEEYRIDGRAVAVYNLAGTASIVRGSGDEVVVRVRRGGSDADALQIETGEIRGRETLRIVYPDDRVVYDAPRGNFNSTVRVRSDGTFSDGGRRGGARVEVSSRGRGLEAYADLEIMVPRGTNFSLYLAVGETDADGIAGNLEIDVGSGKVTATSIAGALSVDTGSGSVFVREVRGDLSVDTGSGGVEIEDVEGSEISVDTGSGSVEGAGLTSRVLNVDTGSGSVRLTDVRATDVVVDTGSGSVSVDLLSDIDQLDIDTGSGGITVRLPASVGAEIEIDTGSGGIDLDFPVQVRSASRDHVTGRIGDGRGSIRLDTGSGSIRLIRSDGRDVR